jgi:uncharacterized protein
LIFGLIHGYLLLWVGDILYAYGLMGMFLYPFRKVTPHKLFLAGIVLILSPLWLKYYKMGPLERMWRWLIYKKQPELAKQPDSAGDS